MLLFNHPRQPAGGHVFTDPSGYLLKSDKLDALIRAIATYRSNNGLPAGNPEAEIETVYKAQFPWLVSKAGQTPAPAIDPVARWIARLWQNPPRRFVEHEAEKGRRAVCEACPHHVSATSDLRKAIIIGAGRWVSHGSCTAHRWDCGMACLMESHPDTDAVDGCWVTTENASGSTSTG